MFRCMHVFSSRASCASLGIQCNVDPPSCDCWTCVSGRLDPTFAIFSRVLGDLQQSSPVACCARAVHCSHALLDSSHSGISARCGSSIMWPQGGRLHPPTGLQQSLRAHLSTLHSGTSYCERPCARWPVWILDQLTGCACMASKIRSSFFRWFYIRFRE